MQEEYLCRYIRPIYDFLFRINVADIWTQVKFFAVCVGLSIVLHFIRLTILISILMHLQRHTAILGIDILKATAYCVLLYFRLSSGVPPFLLHF